jgi:hypothetical protein
METASGFGPTIDHTIRSSAQRVQRATGLLWVSSRTDGPRR